MEMNNRGGGSGSGSGSGSGVEPNDESICEFVMSEITCGILEETPMMFGTINKRIMELLDECRGAFRAEIVAGHLGTRTLYHQEFKARGIREFFGEEDHIATYFSEGLKMDYASCL